MTVKILEVSSGQLTVAAIESRILKLPGIHDGWRFSLDKHIKKLKNASAYVLVTEETPDIIEGCLIFQMKEKTIPYAAFIEVAPHNKGEDRKYDYVAGCLIAYAFKLSLIHGQGDYRGLLTFDVMEENQNDQIKLMAVYSKKYNAVKVDDTTMYIMDEGGEQLIERYLNRKD